MISSSRSWSEAIIISSPSLIVLTSGAVTMESFSIVIFALISCIIAMAVLATITNMKIRSLYEPTAMRATAIISQSILKNVNIFLANIDQ